MEEFLENLIYSATFLEMDMWRRFSGSPVPRDCVLRVFVNAELRLQQRYGFVELERRAEILRRPWAMWQTQSIWSKLASHLGYTDTPTLN